MYKMVILDLDGTLLTSEKKISPYTKDIIKKLSKKVKIILASARGINTIKPYAEQLEILNNNNYIIAFNGSLIVDNLENVIVQEEINKEEKEILQQYINDNLSIEWYYYTYERRFKNDEISDIHKFLYENKIYKIVCIANQNKILDMRKNMSKDINNAFQITSSETDRIEFVKKGMKKIEAIKILLNKLNISTSEVIAIGDGENDIDMIKYAGCGVAMGNATEVVKNVADNVTDTNDNDGVGKILERLFQ